MTYVGDLQRFGGGSVGATEAWGKTTAQWLQDVASRAGANYRKDIFWIAPGNALNALGALQQCWQNNQPVNIMQMMQSGVAVFKPFNYSTDMLSFPVSPGDIFAIPKDWGLMPACAHGVVDINGKPVTIDPQSKSKTAAPTVMHRAPGLPSSSKPLPTASKPLPTTSKPAVSAPTRAPVAPSSIAKKSTAIYWLGGLVVVLGGVAAYLKYGAGVKSNPRRPPKKWFRDCERGVGPGYDPGRVCGALWYHKMSPARKRAALAKENPGKKTRTVEFAGFTIDKEHSRPKREYIDTSAPGDYGADPLGDGTFRMVPSGDIVDFEERNRRLAKENPADCPCPFKLE